MKKIGVIIGAIVGAACAGITVYLLGNPFASAAVGFVWCYTGYFLGKYIEKKKGSNKQEKRWQLQVYQDDDRLETWYFLQQKYNISPLIHINSGKLNFMILIKQFRFSFRISPISETIIIFTQTSLFVVE